MQGPTARQGMRWHSVHAGTALGSTSQLFRESDDFVRSIITAPSNALAWARRDVKA
jgi:hypothetical protein